MINCLECFCESGFSGRELQKLVDELFPAFACEMRVCSPYSPGPVEDDEQVAFILIDPLHYDSVRDVVVPEAFQELTNRDLSLLRVAYATSEQVNRQRDELIQRGRERIPPQSRLVNEVCTSRVGDLRQTKEAGQRLLGVYDTALENISSHASVFTRTDVLEDRKLRKIVRNRIHALLSPNRKPFGEFTANLAA
jgi:hypothetical protein